MAVQGSGIEEQDKDQSQTLQPGTQYVARNVESNDRRRFYLSLIVLFTWSIAAFAWVAIAFLGPVYSADGLEIVNDRPGTIAALLGVVGVVASVVIGFWFGSVGRQAAERTATEATKQAAVAVVDAKEAERTAADSRAVVAALTASDKPSVTVADLEARFPRAFSSRERS